MTAYASPSKPQNVEQMFRDHLAEMHRYARELGAVLGSESPIVKRIHGCADSNRIALDGLKERQTCCCACQCRSGAAR